MNIILFNHYAGSPEHGMEYRPYFMAKYWVREGHKVTIIASSFSHLRNKQPLINKMNLYQEEIIDDIRYIWLRGNGYTGNGVSRFVNILLFTILGMFLNRRVNKCDLIITSSTYPLDIFPAKIIKYKFPDAKLVFEPHDLWPMVLYEIGSMKKSHPLVRMMQYAEDLSCRSSDAVISMHPQNIEHLETRGCCRDNFYHIPNGIDLEVWNAMSEIVPDHINEQIKSLKCKGNKIVMYTGSISVANNVQDLIEISEILKSTKIAFVLIGDGPNRRQIEDLARNKSLNVFCMGRVQKGCIPALLELSDICYVSFKHSPLYKYGMSANKLWDYMMASKPIVMSINSSNDPVKEANCGITVSSGCTMDIAMAFQMLLSKSDYELDYLGKNGKNYVEKNNNYKMLSNKFLLKIFKGKK
jgi:glycosyltransferase involved in cell wall biosynthesis